MSESFFRFATRDDRIEIQVEIEVESWGAPATWDDPAEGVECFVKNAWLLDADGSVSPSQVELTYAERERIELEFAENPPEQEEDYDHFRDDWREEA